MNLLLRAAAAAALVLPLAVAPAPAQNYRGGWTLYGGGTWISNLNRGGDKALLFNPNGTPFVGTGDLAVQGGWQTGSQLEYWPFNGNSFLGRLGFRANGSYTSRPFKTTLKDLAFADLFRVPVNTGLTFDAVNTWLVDGDLLFRILRPTPTRIFSPFINLGAGVAIYAPPGDETIVVQPADAFFGNGVTLAAVDSTTAVIPNTGGNNRTKFTNVFGLGTDIIPGKWHLGPVGLGMRLEAADHIAWNSPADPIVGSSFGVVHNLRFSAGVLGTIGRMFPPAPAVAILPPPAPPPPPAAEAITVCVVNPTTDQLETVSAMYMPASRDTMVTINGQQVNFDQAFPNRSPLYAQNADWFVAGRPLELTVDGTRSEWVSFGGPRSIEPSDLALLGTLNGTPIYVAADEAARLRTDLMDLQRAASSRDLAQMARERADVARDIANIDVVYVPLQPGCVFQPFKRTEEVRKVRG